MSQPQQWRPVCSGRTIRSHRTIAARRSCQAKHVSHTHASSILPNFNYFRVLLKRSSAVPRRLVESRRMIVPMFSIETVLSTLGPYPHHRARRYPVGRFPGQRHRVHGRRPRSRQRLRRLATAPSARPRSAASSVGLLIMRFGDDRICRAAIRKEFWLPPTVMTGDAIFRPRSPSRRSSMRRDQAAAHTGATSRPASATWSTSQKSLGFNDSEGISDSHDGGRAVERIIHDDMSWITDDDAHKLLISLLTMRRYEVEYRLTHSTLRPRTCSSTNSRTSNTLFDDRSTARRR